MFVINKPDNLEEVQCYKCKTIMKTHPMSNLYSDYFAKCEIHNKENQNKTENTPSK